MAEKGSILELFRLGLGRFTCDNNAISGQLQLQLPTRNELGKKSRNKFKQKVKQNSKAKKVSKKS